jgi:hypothetical protein
MLTPFDQAADVLFTDPSRSVAGTFAADGGSPVAVRVVVAHADPKLKLYETGARSGGLRAWIPRATITARPDTGDVLTVSEGGLVGSYVIRDVESEVVGGWWSCTASDAEEAAE